MEVTEYLSDKTFVGLDITGFENTGKYRPVSRVTLLVDDENVYTAGDDTGLELTASCPHATQEMVNALLTQLQGYQYQSFTADAANLDPAAELGDGVTVNGIYSIISQLDDDGRGFPDISSPGEVALEEEYPSAGPMTQEFNRQIAETRSRITKTAEEIRLEVENELEGLEAEFSVTAGEIRSYVDDQINGVNSTITQTANSLTAQINAVDGRVTSLSADLDGIEARVQGVEGDYSSLSIKLGSIESTVSDVEGNLSTVRQTVNGLEITTSGLEDSVDGLGNGTTRISGYCIQTGKISAEYLEVGDLIASRIGSGYVDLLDSRDRVVGTMSISSSSSATSGQGVNITAPAIGLNADEGDVYISSAHEATYLHVNDSDVTCKGGFRPTGSGTWNLGSSSNKWANVYATNGTIQTSDRAQKTDIVYGLDDYEPLFDGLKVCTYRMKDGGKRKHHGLIAQDIEETMLTVGVSDMDFAGFIKSPDGDGTYDYALRYSEFIPLLIDQEQKSKKRIADLEARVKVLEATA